MSGDDSDTKHAGDAFIESALLSMLLLAYYFKTLWYYGDRGACLRWKRIKSWDVKSYMVLSMGFRMVFQIIDNAVNGGYHFALLSVEIVYECQI